MNRKAFVDMNADPGEMNNLATDPSYQTVLVEHRGYLAQWCVQTNDQFIEVINSIDIRRKQ